MGTQIGFHWIWMFLLFFLPLIIRVLPGKSKKNEFIYITSLPHYLPHEPKNKVYFLFGLAMASWLFLIVALTRPFYLDTMIVINRPHRDIMLAVDISDSMEIQDMYDATNKPISRFQVVKKQLKEFIENRDGKFNDRMGVILFADHAYVLSPLTFDKKSLLELVDEIDASMAGQLTNIGDAINLAVERFEEAGTNQKIMILLSDGRNTAEGIQPLEAAAIARDKDMKIYTIGFGGGVFSSDDRGLDNHDTSAELDEDTLKKIAETTHGAYYRARDSRSLHGRYQEINFLEATESDAETFQPERELYFYPLIISLILALATAIQVRRING